MKPLLFAASALAVAVGVSAPSSAAPSREECVVMFQIADANDDGWVNGAQAYTHAMRRAGLLSLDTNNDRKLNVDEFVMACVNGAFNDFVGHPPKEGKEGHEGEEGEE